MTVKDANKWLDRVQNAIDNTQKIRKACVDNPGVWEEFADNCDINMSSNDFSYVIIEALVSYKNLMKEKIDNTKVV